MVKRHLEENPQDVEVWIEYCCLLQRFGGVEELAQVRPSSVLREALWLRVTQDLTLAGAVLPLFGLQIPQEGTRQPPGRFWEGHYRLGKGDGFYYDRKTGFPLEVERLCDGGRMVLVPDGPTLSMTVDVHGDEVPGRQTGPVRAFFADRAPITVGQYQIFLRETRHTPPEHWETQKKRPRRPVVFVSFLQADAYSLWADARLLGSLGWEKAARGTSGSPTPWKVDGRPVRHANLVDTATGERRTPDSWDLYLEEVETRPDGVSPFGLLDTAGNVREWCGDRVESLSHYSEEERHWILGSSWMSSSDISLLPAISEPSSTLAGDLGFRLGRPLSAMVRSIERIDLCSA
jgi:formylglycine-generating enzyme required for sulfatase activity